MTAFVASCASLSGGQVNGPTPLASPRPTSGAGSAASVGLGIGSPSPARRLTPIRTATPTVFVTPTITSTPGPPTATPTPAPDEATASAAQSVDDALVAFAQAQAAGDPAALLKAQRALLAAAAAAAPVANGDPTPYGKQLREALGNVAAASTGGYDQMVDAHKTLTLLTGGSSDLGVGTTPVAILPHPPAQNQQVGLAEVTSNLQKAVNEYITATNSGNQDSLLTAQRDLLQATAAADAASKVGTKQDAKDLQRIVTLLNDGFRGDTGKFQDAATALGSINPQQPGTAVAEGTATAGTTSTHVDIQPLQNDVDNKLQSLENLKSNPDKQGMQHAEDDLKQSIQKAQDAIADDHSPAADKLRDALGHASEAANGDTTKIQVARDQLKAALGQ
jgi:hypothetical protein